jgi:hypothetical protein
MEGTAAESTSKLKTVSGSSVADEVGEGVALRGSDEVGRGVAAVASGELLDVVRSAGIIRVQLMM